MVRKNNLAAKKSRDTRRMRENQLRLRVLFLENANKVIIILLIIFIIIIIITHYHQGAEGADGEEGLRVRETEVSSFLFLFFFVCDILVDKMMIHILFILEKD